MRTRRGRGFDREVPGALRYIHGERATAVDLLLVYATAAVIAALALVFAFSRVADLPWWKALLLALIAADTGGGAVATFSRSLAQWYAERPRLRWAFLFVHLEPVALFLLFGGSAVSWIFLYAYAMAAGSLVMVLRGRERREAAAAAFLAVGIVISLPVAVQMPFLAWFGPVYLAKLVLGFSPRRAEED